MSSPLLILLLLAVPIENVDLGNTDDLISFFFFRMLLDGIRNNINTTTCVEGFCKAIDYPKNLILTIVNENEHYKKYFGRIVEPFAKTREDDRALGKANVDNYCKINRDEMYPEIGMNLNGAYRYIVNFKDGGYNQLIGFERCREAGSACGVYDYKPLITTCKQVYSVMRLVVLSEKKGKPVLALEDFKIPSTCGCHYVRN